MAIPWAFQYERQFRWLRDTRAHLYRAIALARRKTILEPGCSIALISEEIADRSPGFVVGLDTDFAALSQAKQRAESLNLVCGTIYAPPFKSQTFDAIMFQFFLLWLKEPVRALRIMVEMLEEGGSITAIAEPDYGGRIDYPEEMDYTPSVIEKLKEEGADPFIGRKLNHLFRTAMLESIQWGLASIPFGSERAKQHFEMEWQFIKLLFPGGMGAELQGKRALEQNLINEGKRSYFMPVFHCTAEKPKRY
jgi:SAM-dependent methyltransferase